MFPTFRPYIEGKRPGKVLLLGAIDCVGRLKSFFRSPLSTSKLVTFKIKAACARKSEGQARAAAECRRNLLSFFPAYPRLRYCMFSLRQYSLHKLRLSRRLVQPPAYSASRFRAASTVSVMPKRKIPEVSSAFNVAESSSSTQATADGVPETPVRRRSTRTKKQKVSDDAWDYPVSFEESSPLTALSDVDSSPKNLSGKKIAKRRKKNDEPVVYDIPPVERKHTNFKGTHLVPHR